MTIKYLIKEYKTAEEEREGIQTFDKQMSNIRIPKMLLERLKSEFDKNFKLSVRNSISPDNKQGSGTIMRNSNLY
jgi:hypothetical protein